MVKLNDVSKEMISRLTNEQCYDLIMDWAKEYAEPIYEFGTSDREAFLKTIGLWKASGKKVRKDVGKWSDLQEMFGYLYTPEDKLELEYEIDDKYTKENINEVVSLYKQDLFLDSEDWFGYMKAMGETIGYCPNVKEYKNNPEGYKGSITDVCTIVRVAITGKQNSPDLFTIMNVIGKENTLKRLDKFLEHVNA
jgi:glutamyl-tRNA synthetase